MKNVRAKKHLGQHFLKDESIAAKIADSLSFEGYQHVLEIGPGDRAPALDRVHEGQTCVGADRTDQFDLCQ